MNRILTQLILLIIIVVLFTSALWFARPLVADYVLKKITHRLKTTKDVIISFQNFEMIGWSQIHFEKLSLGIQSEMPLLKCEDFQLEIALLPLLEKRLKITHLNARNAELVLQADSLGSNFLPLLKSKKTSDNLPDSINRTTDLGIFTNRLLRIAFDALPEQLQVDNAKCFLDVYGILAKLEMSKLSIFNDTIQGNINIAEVGISQSIKINGIVERENRGLSIKIQTANGKQVVSPLLKQVSGIHLACDSLLFRLQKSEYNRGVMFTEGSFRGDHFTIHHPKISNDTVAISHLSMLYKGQIAGRIIKLDSGYLEVNYLPMAIQAALRVASKPRLNIKASNTFIEADSFIQALPTGLFPSVEGLKAKGQLSYRFYMDVDLARPDSLKFSSSLVSKNFKISKYGKANISKLNAPFEYTTQDYPYRKLWVGEENPNFYTLEKISPYLKNSIITAEDGSFYHHKGFNEEAFRKSIISNIKAGRFVRGGSTITMQLVKNIFLSRKKTIARKLDETLLVWLIESNRLVSKDRMFEVYLNIIEWAPGIYGVGEAAPFYFGKNPSELNLQESIYLSSIVPRPKSFKYSFDGQGNLKPYLSGYYRLLSNIMLRRGLITDQDTVSLQPNVVLTGPAHSFLFLSDTLPAEEIEEEFQEIDLLESPQL